jgi:hypothetical protein
MNVASNVNAPSSSHSRREGIHLSIEQVYDLADTCKGRYSELVLVLGLAGLRWAANSRACVSGSGLCSRSWPQAGAVSARERRQR